MIPRPLRPKALLLLTALPCLGQAPSFQGYTGLLNTPDALVTPDGRVDWSYTNQADNHWRKGADWADNHILTIGMFPGLEGTLRVTEVHSPLGNPNDLSANIKVQIPFLPAWFPKVALGAQDFGGTHTTSYLRTRYGVMTQEAGPVRLSLGYGSGPARMKGLFGGAEWTTTPWLHLLGEYDTTDRNLGARLMTPPGLLPGGLSLGVLAKYSLDFQPHHVNVAVSLRVPLGGAPRRSAAPPAAPSQGGARETPPAAGAPEGSRPAQAPALPQPAPAAVPAPPLPPAPSPAVPPPTAASTPPVPAAAYPAGLAARLVDLGFENVRAGVRGRTLVLQYENNRYNHNELDALGLCLGSALAEIPADFDTFLVAIRRQDLRVLEVEGPVAAFRAFFRSGEAPDGILIRSLAVRQAEAFGSTEGVTWAGEVANRGWLHSRLTLAPGLSTVIATEIGRFNYRLSLKADYQASLWPGAVINYRWDIPVSWSEHYGKGGAFNTQGTGYTLDRIWFSQAVPIAPGLMAQVGGGNYDQEITGYMADLMWSPGSGRHRFWAKSATFQEDYQPGRKVLLGAYRYYFPALDTYVEATGGRFYNRDKGYRIDVKRFFEDTSITVSYTKTDYQTLSVAIALPLTPRRDMKPRWAMVRGSDRWSYGLHTVIRNPEGINQLISGPAEVPSTTLNLERSFYNGDRLNEAYLRAHLLRLREAWLTWRPAPGR
jgi:hypothetical protein